ncbi:hypothetical protein GDO86_012856 [Hymenochirus boettgeri]|uniref:NXPE C-terminal domain-containing protein n=1 Tax=Hymenochirus boettgeri TaxID=247094 RepID=A0A8T2ISD4_9PIPI|nr:hypothetical protein GDO86_012856 [Hymenochirus boettgeri]
MKKFPSFRKILLQGEDMSVREKELQNKEKQLLKSEIELLNKETELQNKETDLQKREKELQTPESGCQKKETELQKDINKIFHEVDSKILKISFTHIDNTTKAQNSKAIIIDPKDKYCVGDSLIVQVDMFDYLGKKKTFGGDFIMARIYSPDIKASISGRVEDLNNGSYHIYFTLFWEGTVHFSILLIHPSEGVSALWKARNKGYGYTAHTGRFVSQGKDAQTQCAFKLNISQELCEYSNPKEEEYFYCKKPANMSCGSMVQLMSVFVDSHSFFSEKEKQLFDSTNICLEISKNFETISVSQCNNESKKEEMKKCSAGMKYNYPSGYFYQNMWNPLYCSISRYRTMDAINECMKGKIIYMIGDSTMFQWVTYINNHVNSLKLFNLYNENWPMTRLYIDTERNIKIEWRKHAFPFIMLVFHTFKEEFTIPQQIDQIPGNQHTVVVFTLGMHFRLFPLQHYIRRIINIRRAIERLHLRSPETKVVVKAENTSDLLDRLEILNNFHGYLQYSLMMEIFQGLNIAVVDAWDMSIAYASQKTHPPEEVIANEIDLLLTYMC